MEAAVVVAEEGFRDLVRGEAVRVLVGPGAVVVQAQAVAEPAGVVAMEPRARAAAKVARVRRICGTRGRAAGRRDLARAWAADWELGLEAERVAGPGVERVAAVDLAREAAVAAGRGRVPVDRAAEAAPEVQVAAGMVAEVVSVEAEAVRAQVAEARE